MDKLVVHPAPGVAPGEVAPGVLLLQGGGYQRCAPTEGQPVADWLTGLGIHVFQLAYPTTGEVEPPEGLHPAPLEAAVEALTHIRAGAHGLALGRIGVLGFSAGGHLAASLCHASQVLGEPVPVRPDFAVLGYPVLSMTHLAHGGSARRLLGLTPTPEELARHTIVNHVDAQTPPTFLWHTAADTGVSATHSLDYARALQTAGVPYELHVFSSGRHGLGVSDEVPATAVWTELCATWLRAIVA
ncbi:alpha/beta hydrolase [Propionibacteriaceae bacterium Y1685]